MTVLAEHATLPTHRPAHDGALCDGLPRQAAGPRFRFDQPNPVAARRTYAQSLYAELPYLVGVLVRGDLRLSETEWDCLVVTGAALDVTGAGEYRIPFTFDLTASVLERPGRAPEGVCPDCWGTGMEIDSDGTITGVLGQLFVCFCARPWA